MNDFKYQRGLLWMVNAWVLSALLVWPADHVQAQQVIEAYIPNETPDSRYTVHGNGTVTDKKTKLMWKQCSEGQTNNGASCSGTASTMTWKTALETAKNSTFAGHDDWRVPNIKELNSIVARDRRTPSINATVFPNTAASDWYWSSSPYADSSNYAWIVYFSYGLDDYAYRNGDGRVRLVRGGQ